MLLHTGMRALETPLFPESYGRLASVGMCPGCRDGGVRAVGRVEALPDVFLQGALKYTIHPYKN